MDVLRFINSNALRKYLKEIDYKFNGFEAAWLVWNCRTATLEEKHAAWREIIETYPDEEYKNRQPDDDRPPLRLHETLVNYMVLEKKMIDFVKAPPIGSDFVYTFDYREYPGGEIIEPKTILPDFDSAIKAALEDISDLEDEGAEARIYKRPVGGPEYDYGCLTVNKAGEITWVYLYGRLSSDEDDLFLVFDDMWFDFPVPFKKGDILYDPLNWNYGKFWSGPFVYTECATDIAKEKGRPLHDNTDMVAWGEFQNEDGILYRECMHDYTSLEYYPADMLTGFKRALIAYSNFVKGELEDELFAKAYAYILADEHAKDLKPRYYTEEGMRLAGLDRQEVKE